MGDLNGGLLIPITLFILFSLAAVFLYRIPLRLSLSGSNTEKAAELCASIGWGPVDLQVSPSGSRWKTAVSIGSSTLYQGEFDHEPDAGIPSPVQEMESSPRALIRYIPLIKRVFRVVFHHIEVGSITGDFRFGAGDPVTTGLVFGYYHAIRPMAAGFRCTVNLTPDFTNVVLEGEAKGVLLITCPFGMGVRIAAILLPVAWKDVRSGNAGHGRGPAHA